MQANFMLLNFAVKLFDFFSFFNQREKKPVKIIAHYSFVIWKKIGL